MTEYRQLRGSVVWHWMATCHHWNRTIGADGQMKSSVKVLNRVSVPPLSGVLCNECGAKDV